MAITRSSKQRSFVASPSRNVRNMDFNVLGVCLSSHPNESSDIQGIPNSFNGSDRLPSKRKRSQTSLDIIGQQRDSPTEVDVNGSGQPVAITVSEHDRIEDLFVSSGGLNSPPNNQSVSQGTIGSSSGNDQQPTKRKMSQPWKEVIDKGQASPTEVEHGLLVQPLVIEASHSENHKVILVSDGTSYSPSSSTAIQRMAISSNQSAQWPKKCGRGPNKMKVIDNGKDPLTEVEFNELGQPVGDNAASFCSFLGCLVREKIPIAPLERWTRLSVQCKNDLWSCVKKNYLVDDHYKKEILQRMSVCWRKYKAKITKDIIKISQSDDASHQLALLKPDNIKSSEEWEAFVKQRTSAEFKAISEACKQTRANQTMLHTLGRRGYACLLHEMKKKSPIPSKISRVDVWTRGHLRKDGKPINEAAAESIRKLEEYSKSPEAQTATSIREDALAKVFGPDRRDQARGLGFGSTASKVDVETRGGCSKVVKLEYAMKDLRQQVIDLKVMLLQETRQQSLQGQNDNEEDTVYSSEDTPQGWNVRDEEIMHSSGATSQDQNVRNEEMMPSSGAIPVCQNARGEEMVYSSRATEELLQDQNVKDAEARMHSSRATTQEQLGNGNLGNGNCRLVHWMGGREVVAQVDIVSKDPRTMVHHVKLGPDCWQVEVIEVTVDEVSLFRPTCNMSTLEDAIGSTIAWPIKYIIME